LGITEVRSDEEKAMTPDMRSTPMVPTASETTTPVTTPAIL
jgi:hypothetical protein